MDVKQAAIKRRAIKNYNGKKIPKETLIEILEVTNLAPTSIGLEHIDFVAINKDEYIKELKEIFHNQNQMDGLSSIIIYVARINDSFKKNSEWLNDSIIAHVKNKKYISSKFEDKSIEDLKNIIFSHNIEDLNLWSEKQAYIASAYTMLSAMENGVDSTPVEGFDYQKLNNWLRQKNIISNNQWATLAVFLGYIDGVEKPYSGPSHRKPLEKKLTIME